MTDLAKVQAYFQALSLSPTLVHHSAVTDAASWASALASPSSGSCPPDHLLTKTLVVKPKTAKSALPTPVVILALEATSVNLTAACKLVGAKEGRLASEDLLVDAFGVPKEAVSIFPLGQIDSAKYPTVHVVVDKALLGSESPVALRASSSTDTVFLSGSQIPAILAHLGVQHVEADFAEIALASVAKVTVSKPVEAGKKEKKEKKAGKASVPADEEISGTAKIARVLTRSEMLDYYDVSGCYIIRPLAYNVWREITNFFDEAILEMGIEDTYFPMFVSNKVLEREKDHIEGFAPEVAWVTKAGNSDLEEPIAIRPTSETVMYPYFAKWIRSHRDLPLRVNQWCNVVRWEFKNPQPFLRTREFLWQEGHTAHLTKKGADIEVREILDLYRQVYEDLLAVPVVPGVKSENEKFAGGLYTTTVEGFIPATGRAIQGGTSHCLGQNFAKMFNIVVEDPENAGTEGAEKLHVWQNSWGITTRTIGVMVMVHGDDKGLVLPPRVAQTQVIVIPCGLTASTSDDVRRAVEAKANEVVVALKRAKVKARADLRDNYTPGYKFNHWELRGVPLRLEIGPKDLEKQSVMSSRRDTGEKAPLALDSLVTRVPDLLTTIQADMLARAKKTLSERIVKVREWENVVPTLEGRNLLLLPWCESPECEDNIKDRSARSASSDDEPQDEKAPSMGAKSLCIPFEQPSGPDAIVPGETKCVGCGADARTWALFGRSY
ncbi:prolyl-tRNA synthetase [Piptocephalis cylindrospora]|uniref:proline--tRNA ligase n=1 Tax=Piptocephalis cylindrospora TaxID=1907219 RepID=A0A4P9Y5J3_9FUNG|nr:prolyl-tRNA synthetase [Piptocephalis cylindrospora]|eukprot:RKP14286.1 prolyl-tRNA synthetase [Piptocephalis cylindrospora]